MAKVGYVMNYAGYRANTDKEWMKRFGCNEIMEEQQDYELRTEWNKLLDRLNKGDELVVPKLSHVLRETRQLSYLLEYCRLKEIRLIVFFFVSRAQTPYLRECMFRLFRRLC